MLLGGTGGDSALRSLTKCYIGIVDFVVVFWIFDWVKGYMAETAKCNCNRNSNTAEAGKRFFNVRIASHGLGMGRNGLPGGDRKMKDRKMRRFTEDNEANEDVGGVREGNVWIGTLTGARERARTCARAAKGGNRH